MKESTAEWLHDKGQKAMKQPSWAIPVLATMSLIFFLVWIGIVLSDIVNGKTIIASIGNIGSAGFLFFGIIYSLITSLWYERRHYYEIIQSQEKRIRELEKK